MATKKIPDRTLTRTRNFREIPAEENKPLLQVCEGVPVMHAENEASCLETAVEELLEEAAGSEGMNANIAHLCQFALETAQALRSATYGR